MISVYRINVVSEKEISWDVLGYYMYLPATFIHDDPMLNDISWLKKVNSEKKLADTLYMVTENDKGEPMYFFLMGLALFFLPFFFVGHAFAAILGLPMDGFSPPYQYSLVIGAILYTIIGLIFLRKILKYFFSEKVTALILIILVFGTNYIHHLTIKDLETVNVLFMLTTIVVWCTIKWHEHYKQKHLIAIAVSITLMILIKPSELFILLIPILWNVVSFDNLKLKILKLFNQRKAILIAMGISIIIASPQMIYWYLKTGSLIYDSYKNPGVGLDILSPHIVNVLVSYRKGWLLYTPVMVFSLMGFYFLYKKNVKIFYACFLYFIVSFFIISSWTEWWYGAGYSIRPLITTYPILAVCLGYFIVFIDKNKLALKIIFWILVVFFIFLNQFQWWQLKHYILNPYQTTKEYYWATFLKNKMSESDKDLLLVNRSFSSRNEFTDSTKYHKTVFVSENFEKSINDNIILEDNNKLYRISANQEYYSFFETEYGKLTPKDHLWVKVRFDMRGQKSKENPSPCLVLTMERKNGAYGYSANDLLFDPTSDSWEKVEIVYLTPEIRSNKDHLKCYIWNRGKGNIDIDNLIVEIYQK